MDVASFGTHLMTSLTRDLPGFTDILTHGHSTDMTFDSLVLVTRIPELPHGGFNR